MPDAMDAIEWSQAHWWVEGAEDVTSECDRKLIRDILLERLPKNGRIVDAGCGTAKWVRYLRQRGYRIAGLDISYRACRIARDNDPDVDLAVGDARCAPFGDASVDAVLSLGVVEHDESGPLDGLRELHRILVPGGLLVLEVPFDNLARRLVTNHAYDRVNRRRRREGWSLGFSEYRYDAAEMRNFLARAGFDVVGVFPDDYRPPLNIGFWVDYANLTFNPFRPRKPEELFRFSAWARAGATAAVRLLPWAVCGEIALFARKVG